MDFESYLTAQLENAGSVRLRTSEGSYIKEYCDKNYEIKFEKRGHYKKKEEELFIGFEIEFELPFNTSDAKKEKIAKGIKDNFSDIIAENKHDGSLINGFEAVSHPIHIGYIFTKKFKKRFEALIGYLKSYGANVCSTTGLHFHVSNKYLQQERDNEYLNTVKANVLLIANTFSKELKSCSGRFEAKSYGDIFEVPQFGDYDDEEVENYQYKDERDLFSYCQFMSDNYAKFRAFNTKYLSRNLPCSHHDAINFSNRTTTEFRFFAGTFDYNTFIRNVSLVVSICEFAVDDELIGVTFGDIVNNMRYGKEDFDKAPFSLPYTAYGKKIMDYGKLSEDTLLDIILEDLNKYYSKKDEILECVKQINDTYYNDVWFYKRYCNALINDVYNILQVIIKQSKKTPTTYEKAVDYIGNIEYAMKYSRDTLQCIFRSNEDIVVNTFAEKGNELFRKMEVLLSV